MTFNEIENELENRLEQDVFMFFNQNNPIEDDAWSLQDENRRYLYRVVDKTIAELEQRAKKHLPSFLKQSFIKYLQGEVERLEVNLKEHREEYAEFGTQVIEGAIYAILDQITHINQQLKELQ